MPKTSFSPRPVTSDLPASLLKEQNGHSSTYPDESPTQASNATAISRPAINHTKAFKVRILTWNMHDSLPKGDLEELFDKVPLYDDSTAKPGTFPLLSEDSKHSYHLVVVAGQECPTPSGIPMGLSASFKILDKDREKSKAHDKDSDRPSVKQKERGAEDDVQSEEANDYPPSGWTSMVEDYLCYGTGSSTSSRTGSPSTADIGYTRPLTRNKSTKEVRKGPYQLLIKERLMGIYMAIYIYRDLKPFVRGMSKSAVTAGLIGGRVGNKGGVGISLNIDGTTFLFLNAHLAAHEGKINHRLANLSKIKSELYVDDFLPADDPRAIAEDLTDRFDFTFICGDLNFRLDITRLHADWLISRQDYKQAFEFDQLNALMKQGVFFKGFCEAVISFPPTFKYDVLRTLGRFKKSKTRLATREDGSERLAEFGEPEISEETDCDEEIEGASITASTMTSTVSRPPTEFGYEDDSYLYTSSSTPAIANGIVVSPRVNTARSKWPSLFSSSLITIPNKLLKAENAEHSASRPLSAGIPSGSSSPLPPSSPRTYNVRKRVISRPPPIIVVDSSSPQNNIDNDVLSEEKGVYDSSHKKRVPSWCDRILWKSTIQPDPTPDDINSPDIPHRSRNRVGHFLANAFRPLPPRTAWKNITAVGAEAEALSGDANRTPRGPTSTPKASLVSPSAYSRASPASPSYFRLRRTNTAFSPPPMAPALQRPFRRFTAIDDAETPSSAERSQSATTSIWRFLPSFLSPTHNQGQFHLETPHSSLLVPPLPRKGDVSCLSYHTLDDRGMRRLEGRSDHRPVIGIYTVYA